VLVTTQTASQEPERLNHLDQHLPREKAKKFQQFSGLSPTEKDSSGSIITTATVIHGNVCQMENPATPQRWVYAVRTLIVS
jgi:hypothetical protein